MHFFVKYDTITNNNVKYWDAVWRYSFNNGMLCQAAEHFCVSAFIFLTRQREDTRGAIEHFIGETCLCDKLRDERGRMFVNNVILSFVDYFPKKTEIYKLLTTKPSEVEDSEV